MARPRLDEHAAIVRDDRRHCRSHRELTARARADHEPRAQLRLRGHNPEPVRVRWLEVDALLDLVEQISIDTQWGPTRSPSVEAFVETEIRGWAPLSELFDDHAVQALTEEARTELVFSITEDGVGEFVSPAHVITATKL